MCVGLGCMSERVCVDCFISGKRKSYIVSQRAVWNQISHTLHDLCWKYCVLYPSLSHLQSFEYPSCDEWDREPLVQGIPLSLLGVAWNIGGPQALASSSFSRACRSTRAFNEALVAGLGHSGIRLTGTRSFHFLATLHTRRLGLPLMDNLSVRDEMLGLSAFDGLLQTKTCVSVISTIRKETKQTDLGSTSRTHPMQNLCFKM